MARHGVFLTSKGKINILKSSYSQSKKPISKKCGCYVCQNYSKAYLRHLFKAREMLGPRLATYHNLSYMSDLMTKIRWQIQQDEEINL